ncbi:two-component sensor histidine kinase, partial [Streptomyces sp. NPDC127084]
GCGPVTCDRGVVGHGVGLTIGAGNARVTGARLTFRNANHDVTGPGDGISGAIAVLWLPEHAPTNSGSFALPRLAD